MKYIKLPDHQNRIWGHRSNMWSLSQLAQLCIEAEESFAPTLEWIGRPIKAPRRYCRVHPRNPWRLFWLRVWREHRGESRDVLHNGFDGLNPFQDARLPDWWLREWGYLNGFVFTGVTESDVMELPSDFYVRAWLFGDDDQTPIGQAG